MNSLKPNFLYMSIICIKIGFPPIFIIGFGLTFVSSDILVPLPPHKIIIFMICLSPLILHLLYLLGLANLFLNSSRAN